MSLATRPALGRPPALLVVPAVLAATFLVVPLVALVVDTPWSQLWSLLGTTEVREALWISALTSALTVVICVVVGTPLAWLLARVDFPGRSVLRALVVVPLVLPPVVAGVALVSALGRNGLVGGLLRDLTGYTVPFTTTAVVIAHAFVALPFFVLAVEGAFLLHRGRVRRPSRPPWAPAAGRPSDGSPCRSRCPASRPAARWRGPGRWGSSGRPSPSPATSPARPRPCRRSSTPSCRATPTSPARSA